MEGSGWEQIERDSGGSGWFASGKNKAASPASLSLCASVGGRRSAKSRHPKSISVPVFSLAQYSFHRPVSCIVADVGSATATTSALPSSSDPIVWRPSALDAAAAASTSHERHHQGGPHALPYASTPWGASLTALHPSASPPPALHSLPHGAMQSHTGGFAYPSLAAFPPLGSSSSSPKAAAAAAEGHHLAAAAAEERHYPLPGGQACLLVGPLGIDLAPILYGTAPHTHAGAMLSPRLLPPVDGPPVSPPGPSPLLSEGAEESRRVREAAAEALSSSPPGEGDRCSSRAHEAASQATAMLQPATRPMAAVPPPPRGDPPPPRRQQPSMQPSSQQGALPPPPLRKQRASMSSVALNKEIMGAASTTQLLSLVRAKGHLMDYFNLSSVSEWSE